MSVSCSVLAALHIGEVNRTGSQLCWNKIQQRGKRGTVRNRVFASSLISKSIGRPTEALSPSQGAFKALTGHHQNCHCIFLRKLQWDPLNRAVICSTRISSYNFTTILLPLPPVYAIIYRDASAGLCWWNRRSCNSDLCQENILLAFPNLTNNSTSWFHCWKPYSAPPLLIHSKASSFISAHNYFLLRCCIALQVFSPQTDTQGLPGHKRCSFFLFITTASKSIEGKKRKGRICFSPTCLLEKQIISVAPTNPNSRKQNVHRSIYKGCMSHYILKNFQNQLLQG